MSAKTPEEQYQQIIEKITAASGCEKHIRIPEGPVIFAGTAEAPDLALFIAPQENGGIYYGITVGGEDSSFESADFPTPEDCENAVCEFIAAFVNRKVKFTRIQKRFSYIYESYQIYDESTDQWRTVTENYLDRFILKCFLWKNFSEEWEKTFTI